VFDNKILRKIFEPKKVEVSDQFGTLDNEKRCDLQVTEYCLDSKIKEIGNAYRDLAGKTSKMPTHKT
jgi:hypothetical protein